MLEMKDILLQLLSQVSKDIKANQTAQHRTASGKTAQSLEPEATNTTGILYGNISVNVLETGRKPGAVPKGFKDIILKWMSDKGIFQNEKLSKQKSIAFLIARKIQEHGTALHIEGGKSGVLSSVITPKRISDFETKVLQRFGREVQGEVITTFAK
jgi:hypothetical protein